MDYRGGGGGGGEGEVEGIVTANMLETRSKGTGANGYKISR